MLNRFDDLLTRERRLLSRWDDLFSRERDRIRSLIGTTDKDLFPFIPVSDVFTRNGDLVIDLELPGIDPEKDVSVVLEDSELVIRGERKHSDEIKDENYLRMEATYGSFERHVPVPEETKDSDIKAEYKDGVLEIVVPAGAKQIEKPTPKIIPITSGK